MSSTPSITDPTTWALDREIVLVRVLDATREAVFAAWTDADDFCQWFGPDGFTCTVREMDGRPGGGGGAGRSSVLRHGFRRRHHVHESLRLPRSRSKRKAGAGPRLRHRR